MNRRSLIAVALIVVAATAAVAARWSTASDPAPGAPTNPGIGSAAFVTGPGRVEARSEEIDVAPEISGRLAVVLVDEGDRVEAGQVLARLEQRDFVARVAAATARLDVAKADLDRLVNGARTEERNEADAIAAEALAELDHARIQAERAQRLFAEGVIPREQLDAAQRDLHVAVAKSSATGERAAFVNAAARDDERRRAEGAVALARASLDEAAALLAKTEIRSPIAGVVLRRHKLAGESVSLDGPATAIVTLADTGVLRVRMEIDERDVAAVHQGQRGWVTAEAFGDQRFSGRIVRIAPMFGRKKLFVDQPVERIDTKVLEALMELEPGTSLPIGLRVDGYLAREK